MTTTKDDFINTTCDLLEMQGYHATGLNQIVQEGGAPNESLYYYCPGGKEELANLAIEHSGATVTWLVDKDVSVIVVEHHPHLLAACDWIAELRPVRGPDGGYVIAEGTPQQLAAGNTPQNHT